MKKALLAVALTSVAVLCWLLLNRNATSSNVAPLPNPTTSSTTSQSAWTTYANTAYSYTFSYPANGTAGGASEEERVSSEESSYVEAFKSGGADWGPVVVSAVPLRLAVQAMRANSPQYQLFLHTPKEIAQYGLKAEIDYLSGSPSPYNAGLHPSGLSSTTIGGHAAYGFSINGYSEAWPLGGLGGLSLNATHNYFVFQNGMGDKFIIAYPANDPIAQKIVDSFTFTDATSTPARQ